MDLTLKRNTYLFHTSCDECNTLLSTWRGKMKGIYAIRWICGGLDWTHIDSKEDTFVWETSPFRRSIISTMFKNQTLDCIAWRIIFFFFACELNGIRCCASSVTPLVKVVDYIANKLIHAHGHIESFFAIIAMAIAC